MVESIQEVRFHPIGPSGVEQAPSHFRVGEYEKYLQELSKPEPEQVKTQEPIFVHGGSLVEVSGSPTLVFVRHNENKETYLD